MNVFVLLTLAAAAQAAPPVTLTRLDCGTEPEPAPVASFNDTYAWPDLKLPLTYSCYLVRHGVDYMVWDAGHAVGSGPEAPKTSLVDLLRQLKVQPEQVKYVGISHFHADHTGQLLPFTNATLLIGKGDWDGVTANPPIPGANAAGFRQWIAEGRKEREIDPAVAALKVCKAEAEKDPRISRTAKARIEAMHDFVTRMDAWHREMTTIPPSRLMLLIKMGRRVLNLLPKGKSSAND